jgi:hypothetical protein
MKTTTFTFAVLCGLGIGAFVAPDLQGFVAAISQNPACKRPKGAQELEVAKRLAV